jgi:hypothetical protein
LPRPPFWVFQSVRRPKMTSSVPVHIILEMYVFINILFWYILFSTFHVCMLCNTWVYRGSHSCHGTDPTKFCLYALCTRVYRCHWCQFGFGINTYGTDSKCM